MSFSIEMTLRGVLLAGNWADEVELKNKDDEYCRNGVITGLNRHSKLPELNGHIIENYYQRFNNDELVGKAAVAVFLQQAGLCDLETLKKTTDDGQRNGLIDQNHNHTYIAVGDLQGMTNQKLVQLGLEWAGDRSFEKRIAPQPGDPFYDPILDPVLAKLSWEATPRTVIIGLANFIPEVGGFISKAVSLVWPDPESIEKLIKKSEERMKEWVKLEIDARLAKYDTEKLRQQLEGIRNNLKEYVNAASGKRSQWMDNCISQFNQLKPTFLNPEDYHGSLPLVQSLGSLHISLLRERLVYYDEIYKGDQGSPHHKQSVETDLTTTIRDYRDFTINKACPKIIESRNNQITIEESDPPRRPFPHLIDAGRNINVLVYRGARDLLEQYKAYFINDLELKLQKDVKDVALLWTLLDPNSNDKEPIRKDRVVWIGPVGLSQHDIQYSEHGLEFVNGYTKNVQTPVEKIYLKHGNIIDYIWFWAGKKRDSNGNPRGIRVGDDRSGHGAPVEFKVPDGEYIRQIDTYWNYVCNGIQFHYTNKTSSPVYGSGAGNLFKAAYPDHIVKSIAVYGNTAGIGEFYFGFSPSPKRLFS